MCFLLEGWFTIVLTSKTEEYDHKILYLFNEVIEILDYIENNCVNYSPSDRYVFRIILRNLILFKSTYKPNVYCIHCLYWQYVTAYKLS